MNADKNLKNLDTINKKINQKKMEIDDLERKKGELELELLRAILAKGNLSVKEIYELAVGSEDIVDGDLTKDKNRDKEEIKSVSYTHLTLPTT